MDRPIRILAIVPEPAGAAWASAAAAAWAALAAQLEVPIAAGGVTIVRLAPTTENAFEDRLQREAFDVVHVVAHGASNPAARYGTVTLEGSDRRARSVNAQNFARLCAQVDGLQLVVLQAADASTADLSVLGDAVLQYAAPVVALPGDSRQAPDFSRAFYAALASGESIESAFAIATRNPSQLPAAARDAGGPELRLREQAAPAVRERARRGTLEAGQPAREARPSPPQAPVPDPESSSRREVERKRLSGDFDVFLCHNVADKPSVMEIGRRLMDRGVLPWLDQWELRPGIPWQRILEEQIAQIRAAAVFVGRERIGPWQRQELDGFLREFNKRGCPVIPVLLPGAGGEPELPLFLRGMTWVDFRVAEPDPIAQLVWGITGQRPF